MALTYHRARWPKVTLTQTPPPPPTHTHIVMYKSYIWHLNKHGFTVLGWPFNQNKTAAPSNCPVLDYPTVPSSTRADTVVANATAKKVDEQDTKTFPNCYVGRNGKRNKQKLQLQDPKTLKT